MRAVKYEIKAPIKRRFPWKLALKITGVLLLAGATLFVNEVRMNFVSTKARIVADPDYALNRLNYMNQEERHKSILFDYYYDAK